MGNVTFSPNSLCEVVAFTLLFFHHGGGSNSGQRRKYLGRDDKSHDFHVWDGHRLQDARGAGAGRQSKSIQQSTAVPGLPNIMAVTVNLALAFTLTVTISGFINQRLPILPAWL